MAGRLAGSWQLAGELAGHLIHSAMQFSAIPAIRDLMHPVDCDYLLFDYCYYVVWHTSCTKRVKRDYFYLDYSFLVPRRLLILISMRVSRRPGIRILAPQFSSFRLFLARPLG